MAQGDGGDVKLGREEAKTFTGGPYAQSDPSPRGWRLLIRVTVPTLFSLLVSLVVVMVQRRDS